MSLSSRLLSIISNDALFMLQKALNFEQDCQEVLRPASEHMHRKATCIGPCPRRSFATMSLHSYLTTAYKLPEHCTPTSQYLIYLSSVFHSCVPTPPAFISTALGIFSIIAWLFAQLPQIYKNYTLQSASGLSVYFLTEWLLGDLTNLLGALLTRQAEWQVVVAAYYVTVDVCLMSQYIWYSHINAWRKPRLLDYHTDGNGDPGALGDVLVGIAPSNSSTPLETTQGENSKKKPSPNPRNQGTQDHPQPQNLLALPFSEKSTPPSSRCTIVRSEHSPSPSLLPKTVLLVSLLCVVLTNASPLDQSKPLQEPDVFPSPLSADLAGRILSWTSTLLYLGSRIPQIYKNAIRRSTSGLSPTLFIAAFFGNLFYSTSLITNPLAWSSYPPYGLHGWAGADGSDRKTWISLAAPFWLGAAGVLASDAVVGAQFIIYGDGQEQKVPAQDREGKSRWPTAKRWMKQWAPSPTATPHAEEPEEQTSLTGGRQSRGSGGYGAT